MIIGTGCDMLEIQRMERFCAGKTADRVFTEEEYRQAAGRKSVLAGDFAVKESVAKALGTGFRGFGPAEIEVLRDELGKPWVRLYGGAQKRFLDIGGTALHVSITDTRELVCAFAVLEGAEEREK